MNAQTKIEVPPDAQLRAALAAAMPELGTVSKNKDNPHFKSRYADLAAVIQSLEPLKAHGLWFRQVPVEAETGVAFETFYLHTSGAELSAGVMHMPVDRGNAQGIGSAQTYCRRYALQAAFGLAADDDDGNAAAAAPPKVIERDAMPAAEWAKLTQLVEVTNTNVPTMFKALGIRASRLDQISATEYTKVIDALERKLAKMAKDETNAEAEREVA